jgi:hypothetical protein
MHLMKNNCFALIFLSMSFGCQYQKGNDSITEAQKEYLADEVNKSVALVDSTSTTREIFAHTSSESEMIYQFINENIQDKRHEICSVYENKTIVIDIVVKDSLIISGSGKVYEFDEVGNLVSYQDGATELAKVFINEDAIKFDFMDSYKLAYYHFRIEANKMCE